jgi:uncharacterized protein YjiS (DUF1127 family)
MSQACDPPLLRRNMEPYLRSIEITGASGPRRRKRPMFLAVIRFLQSWRRYNASLRELSQLNDRQLADIGITRSDIPRVAWDSADQ